MNRLDARSHFISRDQILIRITIGQHARTERHELDESNRPVSITSKAREVCDFVIIDASHHHNIQFDRSEDFRRRFEAFLEKLKTPPTRDIPVAIRSETIDRKRDAIDACLLERRRHPRHLEAVGSHGKIGRTECPEPLDDLDQISADRWLTARDLEVTNS